MTKFEHFAKTLRFRMLTSTCNKIPIITNLKHTINFFLLHIIAYIVHKKNNFKISTVGVTISNVEVSMRILKIWFVVDVGYKINVARLSLVETFTIEQKLSCT